MAKFTKERLEEIAELARKATYKPCEMHMTNLLAVCDSEVIEEMARQLLASMEQEPVAYMHHSGQVVTREECCDDKIFAICCKVETPLYAAPQLPQPAVLSVPDEIPKLKDGSCFKYVKDGVRYSVNYANGWNQCRVAMLQGAEPVTMAYKLPFEQWLSQQTGTIDVDCGCVTTEAFYHWLRVAYEAGNSQVIPDDVRRMDWLVSKTVDVREPMVYGSHSIFWSQTTTDEEDDYHATKLREQIDAAMAAENAAAPQQGVK